MAEKILLLGKSGQGKTFSLRNLNPDTTAIFMGTKKAVSFDPKNKLFSKEKKNLLFLSLEEILPKLDAVPEHIKVIVIDDLQYALQDYINAKIMDKDPFKKYKEILAWFANLINKINKMRDDLSIIIIMHAATQTNGEGYVEVVPLIPGKAINKEYSFEGQFSYVLTAVRTRNESNKLVNLFEVENDGVGISKVPYGTFTPEELINERFIENDITLILNKINN